MSVGAGTRACVERMFPVLQTAYDDVWEFSNKMLPGGGQQHYNQSPQNPDSFKFPNMIPPPFNQNDGIHTLKYPAGTARRAGSVYSVSVRSS